MPSPDYAAALTLEQLLVLREIDRAGSFSAAARSLRRTQGSVSYQVERLEEQLAVKLFDRDRRPPRLTAAGEGVIRAARRVLEEVEGLRDAAWGYREGLESEITLAVDVLFPPRQLAAILQALQAAYPPVTVIVHAGMVEFAAQAVRDGTADVAISGPLGLGADLDHAAFDEVEQVAVVAPGHPLAEVDGPVSDRELAQHVHLILGQPAPNPHLTEGFRSARRWYLRDALHRLVLIEAGLGWARLPRHQVQLSLDDGRLVAFAARAHEDQQRKVPIHVAVRREDRLGPVAKWLWDHLCGGAP